MYCNFKDRSPLETIKLSNMFLLSKGVLVTEEWHENTIDLYSVTLKINGTVYAANGKGINKELALASAHGELQERLLNGAYFRMNSDVFYRVNKNYNADFITSTSDVECLNYKNVMKLISMDSTKYMETFTSNNNKKINIPFELADLCYGTNGMCAGNTKEEAITQGLSEIIERYIAKELINKRFKPKSFDISILENYSFFKKIIYNLSKIDISVNVFDLSLTYNFPAIGVLFVRKEKSSYFFKIGVHPNLNIALERCLTEFVQGKNNFEILNMLNYSESINNNENLLMRYFIDGNSPIPLDIFFDVEEGTLKNNNFTSNLENMNYLVRIIKDMGFNIYYEDNSSPIFSAFRIIVPGMSEIIDIHKEKNIHTIRCVDLKIERIFSKGDRNIKNIIQLYNLCLKNNYLNDLVLCRCPYLDVRVNNHSIIKLRMYELILIMLLDVKEYKLSYNILKKNIDNCTDKTTICILMLLHIIIKNENFNKETTIKNLSYYFEQNVINNSIKIIEEPMSFIRIINNVDTNPVFNKEKEIYKKIYEISK